MLSCKKCTSKKYVKSGHVRGLQRYQCRDCGCQFTATKPRGVPPAVRQLAIVLYAHFGISMRGISRLFKVSTQAVLTWVRAASDRVEEPKESAAELIQVDEMWHFVNGKKTKFGSGERFAGYHAALSDGTSVIVLIRV